MTNFIDGGVYPPFTVTLPQLIDSIRTSGLTHLGRVRWYPLFPRIVLGMFSFTEVLISNIAVQ